MVINDDSQIQTAKNFLQLARLSVPHKSPSGPEDNYSHIAVVFGLFLYLKAIVPSMSFL